MELTPEIKKENVMSEQKIAFKEKLLSKPINISISVTAKHVYGQGYVQRQGNQQEYEPEYQTYVISYTDIDSVTVKPTSAKTQVLSIQSKPISNGMRVRIIIPNLKSPEQISQDILRIKEATEHEAKVAAEFQKEKQAKIKEEIIVEAPEPPKSKQSGPIMDTSIVDIMDLDNISASYEEKLPVIEETNHNSTPKNLSNASLYDYIEPIELIKPSETSVKSTDKPIVEIATDIKESKPLDDTNFDANVDGTINDNKQKELNHSNKAMCPICQTSNKAEAKFCIACGYNLGESNASLKIEKQTVENVSNSEKLIDNNPDVLSGPIEAEWFHDVCNPKKDITDDTKINTENVDSSLVVKKEKKKYTRKNKTVKEDTASKEDNIINYSNPSASENIVVSGKTIQDTDSTKMEESTSETGQTNNELFKQINILSTGSDNKNFDEILRSLSLKEFEDVVQRLKVLKETSMITDEEFDIQKKRLLKNIY